MHFRLREISLCLVCCERLCLVCCERLCLVCCELKLRGAQQRNGCSHTTGPVPVFSASERLCRELVGQQQERKQREPVQRHVSAGATLHPTASRAATPRARRPHPKDTSQAKTRRTGAKVLKIDELVSGADFASPGAIRTAAHWMTKFTAVYRLPF